MSVDIDLSIINWLFNITYMSIEHQIHIRQILR